MRDEGEEQEREYLISTPRLALRPRQADDHAAIEALAANPAIAQNLGATIPSSTECGRTLVILERTGGRLIGCVGRSLTTDLSQTAEVALWIGEPDWGRGYATEAAQAFIDHAFADGDLAVLWCSNRVTNPRARRVIEKCGFQFRGGGMVRLPGRGAFPIERFALNRRTWTSLKAWGARKRTGGTTDAPRETAA